MNTAQHDTPTSEWIENVTYDELKMGQSARLVRTLTLADIQAFAAVSGDTNPTHMNPEYAEETLLHGVIAHGMWGGVLISALLGTQFPGPGTIYLEQVLHFTKPVRIGDTLTVTATVIGKDDAPGVEAHGHVDAQCRAGSAGCRRGSPMPVSTSLPMPQASSAGCARWRRTKSTMRASCAATACASR